MDEHNVFPTELAYRQVGQWSLMGGVAYGNPFGDVVVEGVFEGPTGQRFVVPGFYDGGGMWRVRFSPNAVGEWGYHLYARPENPVLEAEGSFTVVPSLARGFLRATPGEAWGFRYESGEPAMILGDTTYNLFGMAHCGADVEGFIQRRAAQGFNLLRVRLPVSPFHPPDGHSTWQTRRTWPWGGSEQKPVFDRFNVDYFHTVDRIVALAEAEGIGLEMIMEAWGFEYPFNRRDVFVPEWEELWLRYLVARYDAFSSVYFWTPMNEYEYYPDGDWRHNPVADRWAMRISRWLKGIAPHGHIVSMHNGPRMPTFAERFRQDPDAVDAIMFQDWGTRDEQLGWLAAGIEEQIAASLQGWTGSAVFAEWGYERNEAFPLLIPSHAYCDAEHTRRGAWRGAMSGLGIIHGFENSWGPFLLLEEDQEGLAYLLTLRRFFHEIAPFDRLATASELLQRNEASAPGERPLALASPERDLIVVYLPVGGVVALSIPLEGYTAQWFDPVSGALQPASASGDGLSAPDTLHAGHPQDWVLVLRRA
jgi:hypothetical protein